MKKNITKSVSTISNGDNSNLLSPNARKNLPMLVENTFVSPLKVTYKTSDHFAEGKAKLGDFFLEDVSLGSSIEAVALAYNYQVMALDHETKEFKESLILPESDIPFRDRTEYKNFVQKHAGEDIADGINVLVYLPNIQKFGSLFAKKKLLKGGLKLLELSNKTTICIIKTVEKTWAKNVWYVLDVTPTPNKVKEIEKLEDQLKIFNNQQVFEDVKTEERQR